MKKEKHSIFKTLKEAQATGKKPLDLMKEEYERRKYEREERYRRKSKDFTKEDR